MMCKYIDIETDEVLTDKQLRDEYTALRAGGYTEAETYEQYLDSCLNGTLERR